MCGNPGQRLGLNIFHREVVGFFWRGLVGVVVVFLGGLGFHVFY